MSKFTNLEELFEHMLRDMYFAEHEITKALPKMVKHATSDKLKSDLEHHLEETEDQISKLNTVFEICNYKPAGEECKAIKGLIAEGEELMKSALEGAVCDSAIIAAAQKVEHYEIASYGTLCNVAKKLGHNEAARILHEILEQEKATDEKLTKISDPIEEEAMEEAA